MLEVKYPRKDGKRGVDRLLVAPQMQDSTSVRQASGIAK
jgi:hypothetical protein